MGEGRGDNRHVVLVDFVLQSIPYSGHRYACGTRTLTQQPRQPYGVMIEENPAGSLSQKLGLLVGHLVEREVHQGVGDIKSWLQAQSSVERERV